MQLKQLFLTIGLSFTTSTFAAPQKRDFIAPTPYNYIAADDASSTSLAKRNVGGVRLSDGADFTGYVWYGILPLADCIALNSYAHNLGSFRPDEGTECFLYQGHCNDSADFGDLHYDSSWVGSLAEHYDWIASAESFMCFTE